MACARRRAGFGDIFPPARMIASWLRGTDFHAGTRRFRRLRSPGSPREACSRHGSAYDDRAPMVGVTVWIIEERQLKRFYRTHRDAKTPLVAWMMEIDAARYENPAQLKARFSTADIVGDKVIFDIGGNKYRLVARIQYARAAPPPALNGIARIVFIGTHKEYDAIDVAAL
jgi:mRNA interferase HigB